MFEFLRRHGDTACYESLHQEKGQEDIRRTESFSLYRILRTCLTVLIIALSFGVGLLVGRTATWPSLGDWIGPYGDVTQIWHRNDSFAGIPSPHTEATWQSIIPLGRGFITHPKLAPHGKSLSVFHQLHCLHAIQLVYYTQVDNIKQLVEPSEDQAFIQSLGANLKMDHVQHCFDYLRQALMCAADTNLEEADPLTNVTHGWRTPRTCRNYGKVVQFAEKWRNNKDTTILSMEKHHGG